MIQYYSCYSIILQAVYFHGETPRVPTNQKAEGSNPPGRASKKKPETVTSFGLFCFAENVADYGDY